MGRTRRRKRRGLQQRSTDDAPGQNHTPERRFAGLITMTATVNTTLALGGMGWTAITGQWWATIAIGVVVSAGTAAVRLYLR